MKKRCLIAIVAVIGFFVLLKILGVIATVLVPDSKETAEEKKPEPKTEFEKPKKPKPKDDEPAQDSAPTTQPTAIKEGPKTPTIFEPRQWTSADGQRTFVGTFTGFKSRKVTIVKDGEPLTFLAEKLSQADRDFLGQGVTFSTDDGKSYENVFVWRISASAITVMSSSGMPTIPMEQLPEEMRLRFGYDPTKAEMEREAQAKGQAAYRSQLAAQKKTKAEEAAKNANLAKAEKMTFIVLQVVPGKGWTRE